MNYLKRSLCSISRRISKSMLLFLIVLLLGSLISGAISINQATKNVKENIKTDLGALITVQAKDDLTYDFDNWIWNGEFDKSLQLTSQIEDSFNSLIQDSKIKYAELVYNLALASNDFTSGTGFHHENDNKYYSLSTIKLYGVSQPKFSDIIENNILIVEGRSFTEEEIKSGSNVLILDEKFRRIKDPNCQVDEFNHDSISCEFLLNNLNVGEKVKLRTDVYDFEHNLIDYEEIEYEIIGFYHALKENAHNDFFTRHDDSGLYGRAYTSQNNILKVTSNYQKKFADKLSLRYGNNLDYSISSFNIRLTDPEYANQFENKVNTAFLDAGIRDINIYCSTDAYEAVCGPLESLSYIANLILVISVGVAILILSLVVTLFIKDRRHEIGIYVSLGERKWKIASQIILEVYLTGILALILSLYSGNFIGQQLSNSILETQIEKQREVIELKLNKLESVNPDNVNIDVVGKKYEIKMDKNYVMAIFAIGSSVMIISTLVPVAYTLRIKPKDILM